MPRPNAIVASIARVERPADGAAALDAERKAGGALEVELGDGRRVRWEADEPRTRAMAGVLEGIRRRGLSVYLEMEDDGERVRTVRIPLESRVARLHLTGDGMVVELEHSHARHLLRLGSDVYTEFEDALRQAYGARVPVLVTTDEGGEIVDVRPPVRGGAAFPFTEPELRPPPPRSLREVFDELLGLIYRLPWWPWWWLRCVSPARAQQVFDAMAATTCDPITVPPPCIPFKYPDDGCWGRAHEMCRLMIGMGLQPRKVWIQASYPAYLHVSTRNNPNCHVDWSWHVAPTLCVRSGFLITQEMVIDPSLFTAPVTKPGWKLVQNDPSATLTDTDASIFYLWGSQTDPTYAKTNQVLATYRLQLQLRSAQIGPPPYANCP